MGKTERLQSNLSPTAHSQPSTNCRLRLTVDGIVQGVGFRPFVYNLANAVGLVGWVKNTDQGVVIEIEGSVEQLQTFQKRLEHDKPPHALLQHLDVQWLDLAGYTDFAIHPSDSVLADGSIASSKSALILPDLATCPDCLHDLLDVANRRYRYPFTNCTHCGPRFSILQSLPYDRPNTTMRKFQMCPACRAEYENPLDRRFHAQPNACPVCGPHLELWDRQGKTLASHENALLQAVQAIRQGKIIALKGLGGFHLIVDAGNEAAVSMLRSRKQRPDKPLALMYPSLEAIREHCQVSEVEERLLCSSEAPIILLRVKPQTRTESGIESGIESRTRSEIRSEHFNIAHSVAPGNPYLGVMLPYTPLHHLLLAELGTPIVATSGNLSSEPICIDEIDALQRLHTIADLFLVHNRPIARPVDDSIVRVIDDQPTVLRRARGYAPFPITIPSASSSLSVPLPSIPPQRVPESAIQSKVHPSPSHILAVGAHLKNTVALSLNQTILLSPHLGDLDNLRTADRFKEAIQQLLDIYKAEPAAIACDAHPDYYSTQFAHTLSQTILSQTMLSQTILSQSLTSHSVVPVSVPPVVIPVQHHYAHVLSCMVDNHLESPVLGIAWDGTGYGLDGTIWGGEFLHVPAVSVPPCGFERLAHLRSFPLPGGEQAIKEPRRCALGLLYEYFGDVAFDRAELAPLQAFSHSELHVLKTMLRRGINTPKTSSAGRLFDAIAALLGICQYASFEGQAAMQLEFVMGDYKTDEIYPYNLSSSGQEPLILDYEPMLDTILEDIHDHVPTQVISALFHNTLVEGMVAIAKRLGIQQIVLTGGCFQNRYLLERSIEQFQTNGFTVYWHHQLPTNDGGIAAGQIMGSLRALSNQIGGR